MLSCELVKSVGTQSLLLKEADKEALSNAEETPLYMAVGRGHAGATRALLAAGEDANCRGDKAKLPVVLVVVARGHVDILRAVIEQGADLDAGTWPALHYAARKNNTRVIDVLVAAGVISFKHGIVAAPYPFIMRVACFIAKPWLAY